MTRWNDKLQLMSQDATFSTCEIAAMASVLTHRGGSLKGLFANTRIEPHHLVDPNFRLSLEEQVRIQERWTRLCGDSGDLPRLARRLHLTSYGIAGYALLSSENLVKAIEFAELYSPLLNLKFSLSLELEGSSAVLTLSDRYVMEPEVRKACAVLEIAKVFTLLREIWGSELKVSEIHCAGADEAQAWELSSIFGCIAQRHSGLTEIRFEAADLIEMLPQWNQATHVACTTVCEEQMVSLASRFDLIRHIKGILLRGTGQPRTIIELADELCVSARTLRRRLDALATSYNQILGEVRKELSIRYLTNTGWTTDDIAQALGYSETANFRNAFKRWTGESPRDFRQARSSMLRKAQLFRSTA